MSVVDLTFRERVEAGIREAESKTSAEIRVHIDETCTEPVLDRAAFLFKALSMHETNERNGVLIYISELDHKIAVLGDVGIHQKVTLDFWQSIIQASIVFFKEGHLLEGILSAVSMSGAALQEHFPLQKNDRNELANTVTTQEHHPKS